jgi:hypothetical protein
MNVDSLVTSDLKTLAADTRRGLPTLADTARALDAALARRGGRARRPLLAGRPPGQSPACGFPAPGSHIGSTGSEAHLGPGMNGAGVGNPLSEPTGQHGMAPPSPGARMVPRR